MTDARRITAGTRQTAQAASRVLSTAGRARRIIEQKGSREAQGLYEARCVGERAAMCDGADSENRARRVAMAVRCGRALMKRCVEEECVDRARRVGDRAAMCEGADSGGPRWLLW